MGNTLIGVIFALCSMVFFGLYVVPRKHSRLQNVPYFFGMGLGLVVCTLAVGYFSKELGPDTWRFWWLGLLGGILWTVGTGFMIAAVPLIGVSRAVPIKNTTGVLGVFIGVLLFGELRHAGLLAPLLALAGSVLIVLAPVFFARTMASDEQVKPSNVKAGVLYALGACLAYALYSITIKAAIHSGCPPLGYVALIGLGAFVSIMAWSVKARAFGEWAQSSRHEKWLGLLGGLIWTAATFFLFLAVDRIGLAVSWSLIQGNSVAAVGYSLLALGEIKLQRHFKDVAVGLLTIVVGVALLGFAKQLGG